MPSTPQHLISLPNGTLNLPTCCFGKVFRQLIIHPPVRHTQGPWPDCLHPLALLPAVEGCKEQGLCSQVVCSSNPAFWLPGENQPELWLFHLGLPLAC